MQLVELIVVVLSLGLLRWLERRYPEQSRNGHSLAAVAAFVAVAGHVLNYLVMSVALWDWIFLIGPLQFIRISQWEVPPAITLLTSVLMLDFFSYVGHRLMHKIPVLWRLHQLHHADAKVSVFTSILHHPLETVVAAFWLLTAATLFGVPLWCIFAYGLSVMIHAAFCHANIALNPAVSRKLSMLVVTPAYHRVHHSAHQSEGNSNFGELLTIWDRMFATFIDERRSSQPRFRFGLQGIKGPVVVRDFISALAFPLKRVS